MNNSELSAYDNYPELIKKLVVWASQSTRAGLLPLDDMLTAVRRMRLTSAFIGPKSTQNVDPDALVDHEELIELVMRFRDDYIRLAMRTTGSQ